MIYLAKNVFIIMIIKKIYKREGKKMIEKDKITRIKIFGVLWVASIMACSKGIINPNICLLVGIPSGILFMKETRC